MKIFNRHNFWFFKWKKQRINCLIFSLFLFIPSNYGAIAPAWWEGRGVLLPDAEVDDYALVTQGQLKHIAAQAAAEMNAGLPVGAGLEVNTLIRSWQTSKDQADDYAFTNLGQLKTVAKPFYDQLIAVGYTTYYPWGTNNTTADEYALANIGQVKNLFNFDLDKLYPVSPPVPNWQEHELEVFLGGPWGPNVYLVNYRSIQASELSSYSGVLPLLMRFDLYRLATNPFYNPNYPWSQRYIDVLAASVGHVLGTEDSLQANNFTLTNGVSVGGLGDANIFTASINLTDGSTLDLDIYSFYCQSVTGGYSKGSGFIFALPYYCWPNRARTNDLCSRWGTEAQEVLNNMMPTGNSATMRPLPVFSDIDTEVMFDGIRKYSITGNNSSLSSIDFQEFTTVAIFKSEGSSGAASIFDKTYQNSGYALKLVDNNKVIFILNGEIVAEAYLSGGNPFDVVAATYGQGYVRLYNNGVLMAENWYGKALNQSGIDLAVGVNASLNGEFFKGRIHTLMIFSRALPDDELLSLHYYLGFPKKLSPPTIHPSGGSFLTPQLVTLTAEEDATIYYTSDTDGIRRRYTGPFLVAATTGISVVASKGNYGDSQPAVAKFIIDQVDKEVSLPSLGLALWLKADSLDSMQDGERIETWHDQSANLNNAANGWYRWYPDERPTVIKNTTNGKNAVRFKAHLNQFLAVTNRDSLMHTKEVSLFVVARRNSMNDGEGDRQGTILNKTVQGYGYNISFDKEGKVKGTVNGQILEGTISDLNFHLIALTRGAGRQSLLIDQNVISIEGVSETDLGWADIFIGRRELTKGEALLDGDIAEIVLYTRSLSPLESRDIISYLSQKYGIGIKRPSFSKKSGIYSGTQDIYISAESGVAIHYTLDGKIPTQASPIYNGSIQLTEPTLIKAIAVKEGQGSSEVSSVNIIIATDASRVVSDLLPGGEVDSKGNGIPDGLAERIQKDWDKNGRGSQKTVTRELKYDANQQLLDDGMRVYSYDEEGNILK